MCYPNALNQSGNGNAGIGGLTVNQQTGLATLAQPANDGLAALATAIKPRVKAAVVIPEERFTQAAHDPDGVKLKAGTRSGGGSGGSGGAAAGAIVGTPQNIGTSVLLGS